MTDFFGVSMTLIAIVLVALLAISLAAVAAVAVRNRILFRIGLRNIPRRRAQSVLIVLGLMLSTAIIAAAFATGDTVNYSITKDTYDKLGHVDELVQVQENRKGADLTDEQIEPAGLIPPAVTDSLMANLNGNDDVDGFMPVLRLSAPVASTPGPHTPSTLTDKAAVIGIDDRNLTGFEDDLRAYVGGGRADTSVLRAFDAMVNISTARALNVDVGDRIDVFINGVPRTFTVLGVVDDDLLTGWTQGLPNGVLVKLSTLQSIVGTKGSGFIAISNAGGVRDSVGRTDRVTKAIEASLGDSRFEVNQIKRDRIRRAEELGASMTAIFVVLGLFSIAAGLLLIFLILFMLAAERRPEMGMSRAVGMKRLQLVESFMAEGMAYSLTSALAGAGLGVVVSIAMTRAMAYIFNAFSVGIVFHVTWRSLVVAYCLGVVLTFVTVAASAVRVSNMSVVAAIRDVDEPARRATGRASGLLGGAMVLGGAALTAWGLSAGTTWAFGTGVSLAAIGLAFIARALGRPERPVFSATSVVVLALWGLVAGDTLHPITGGLNAGLQTFFVSGVLMVAAATFLVIYNAGLLLGAMHGVGLVFARAVPAVRTAIAYPLANRLRTGMTVAMMSLVVFALVMISTMNLNFRRLFLSADSRGGWDIEVSEMATNTFTDANGNRLGPLGEALDRAFYDTQKVDTISQVAVGNPRTTQVSQIFSDRSEGAPHNFSVLGADDVFLSENKIGLQARASGYATDQAAWQAVHDDTNDAVIDGSVVPGINYANVTESRFTLKGYQSGTKEFEPFAMMIHDTATEKVRTVRVIGIMNRGPSETYQGLFVSAQSFNKALPPLFSRYYIRLKPGADADAEAKKMEAALAQQGVTAHSIKSEVEQHQRLSSSFFYLLQGFMALGLGVGLAALGVIAFRTVVERRQQIGLMRAIGFSRASVALSFMLESAFIAALGIFNGIWLALLLASRLLSSDEFRTAGFTTFYIPWLQIGIMAFLVFAASVLTTLIPSRQASSIPIAEALRYE